MATQLKHADFPPIPVPAGGNYTGWRSPRPNIHVAFSATPAVAAVRDMAAEQGGADKTLEEVAESEREDQQPLRLLLAERNEIVRRLDAGDGPADDAGSAAMYAGINRLEQALIRRTANSPDDTVARLVALAQVTAEGFEVRDEEAASVIRDAQTYFGIGYAHERFAMGAPNEHGRMSRNTWIAAYERYTSARAARLYQQDVIVKPLADRFAAVRAAWPDDHHCGTDPVASVALNAVSYDAEEERYDELVSTEHAALLKVIMCPSPTVPDLAAKLTLFHAEQMFTAPDQPDLVGAIAADARRLGGIGEVGSADLRIREAFATRRAEAAYWLKPDAVEGEEIEVRSNAIVRDAEAVLFGTPATTIDGVVAKLRTLFPHIAQHGYSEHATVDPSQAEFRDGLAAGDGNDQVLWRCIEDLARIGGVNLAEQGR